MGIHYVLLTPEAADQPGNMGGVGGDLPGGPPQAGAGGGDAAIHSRFCT